jgi:hypothetical protein
MTKSLVPTIGIKDGKLNFKLPKDLSEGFE